MLITYEWNFKKFTSQDRLNTLFVKGLIERKVEPSTYGSFYSFFTKSGDKIASFYKDSSFGFCTQATGVELKNVTFNLTILFPDKFRTVGQPCNRK